MSVINVTLPSQDKVAGDPGHDDDHNLVVAAIEDLDEFLTAPTSFDTAAAGDVPLTAKGITAAAADLFRAMAGAVIKAGIDKDGEVYAGSASSLNGMFKAVCRSATRRGLVVQLAAAQTADAIEVLDSASNPLFTVGEDGTVVAPNIGVPLLVLDNAESVPGGTVAGTVILRRPA